MVAIVCEGCVKDVAIAGLQSNRLFALELQVIFHFYLKTVLNDSFMVFIKVIESFNDLIPAVATRSKLLSAVDNREVGGAYSTRLSKSKNVSF